MPADPHREGQRARLRVERERGALGTRSPTDRGDARFAGPHASGGRPSRGRWPRRRRRSARSTRCDPSVATATPSAPGSLIRPSPRSVLRGRVRRNHPAPADSSVGTTTVPALIEGQPYAGARYGDRPQARVLAGRARRLARPSTAATTPALSAAIAAGIAAQHARRRAHRRERPVRRPAAARRLPTQVADRNTRRP